MARRLIISFFATFLASSLLRAVEYEGQFTGKEDGIISSGTKGMLSLSFKFKARFWLSHMGNSPLQNLQFFWNFTDADGIQGHSLIGTSIPTADKVSMPLRDVDPDIRKKIQLYDVLVRIEGKAVDSGKRLYIDFDAGIPGDEGEENFNVSGSPKWSELFYETPTDHVYEEFKWGDGRKRDYISEAAAKHVMKSGFRATDVKVIKARWNLNAFHSWYAQNYGAARREALRRTAQDLIAATESIQDTAVTSASNNKNGDVYTVETRLRGMEIERMSHGLEIRLRNLENDISNRKSPLSELEKFVTKLRGGIPEQFRIPAREQAYQKALKSIGDELDRELKEIAASHPVPNPEYADWFKAKDKELKSRPQHQPGPMTNTLGMKFVPVLGTDILVAKSKTKVREFEAFVHETKYEWSNYHGVHPEGVALAIPWDGAHKFCEWLSKKEGRIYRLPTNAEWSLIFPTDRVETETRSGSQEVPDIFDRWYWEWCLDKPDASNLGASRCDDLKPPTDSYSRIMRTKPYGRPIFPHLEYMHTRYGTIGLLHGPSGIGYCSRGFKFTTFRCVLDLKQKQLSNE